VDIFKPNLTPTQVIKAGAFGGSYFATQIDDPTDYDYDELFDYHFKHIDSKLYLNKKYLPRINFHKTRSGSSYRFWKQKQWIHPRDPYGWFEWWCKYQIGYRLPEEDQRQIKRWQGVAGFNGRWRNAIYRKIHKTNNWSISPRIQQSLLHWGYAVNHHDYQLWLQQNK